MGAASPDMSFPHSAQMGRKTSALSLDFDRNRVLRFFLFLLSWVLSANLHLDLH
jgi:hypothetical protein